MGRKPLTGLVAALVAREPSKADQPQEQLGTASANVEATKKQSQLLRETHPRLRSSGSPKRSGRWWSAPIIAVDLGRWPAQGVTDRMGGRYHGPSGMIPRAVGLRR